MRLTLFFPHFSIIFITDGNAILQHKVKGVQNQDVVET